MDDTLRSLIEAGIALHVQGNLNDALLLYSEALDRDPVNALVLYNVGCLFEEAGYSKEAAEAFEAASKVNVTRDPDLIRAATDYGKVN